MSTLADPRSAKQQAIRNSVTGAVLELLREGGYEAAQIREVSARSQISPRTIYKYFGSQQKLIAESVKMWWLSRERNTSASGKDLVERVLSLYRSEFEMWLEAPNLLIVFQRVQLEQGPEASSWARGSLLPQLEAELAPYGAEFSADFQLIIRAVLHQGMRHHEFGLKTLDQVWAEFERAVRRVARCAEPIGA